MKTLNPKIVNKLAQVLGVAPKTIRNKVSSLAQKYPGTTPNSLAHIYAQQNGKSVLSMLSEEDRQAFPSTSAPINTAALNLKSFRVIQIGKEPDRWYNNWLVQLIIAFIVVGIVAGTIAQVLGIYFVNLLGITHT